MLQKEKYVGSSLKTISEEELADIYGAGDPEGRGVGEIVSITAKFTPSSGWCLAASAASAIGGIVSWNLGCLG